MCFPHFQDYPFPLRLFFPHDLLILVHNLFCYHFPKKKKYTHTARSLKKREEQKKRQKERQTYIAINKWKKNLANMGNKDDWKKD